MSTDITPNQREILYALGLTNRPEKLQSTNGSLDVYITGGSASGTQYAEGATTSPGTGTLAIGRYNATPPTLSDGELFGLQLDSTGALKITGSISVGGTTDNSAYTAGTSTGTPSMGFYHSTIDAVTDGRAAAVAITSKRAMMVNLQTAAGVELTNTSNALDINIKSGSLPAGSNVIGHVITDTGSTTAVTGTVTIAGAVTEATLDAALISQEANTVSIKGLTVFGAVTTNAPTYTTAKSDALSLTTGGALRGDIATIAGTAPTTAGFIDIKGADGNVFVRQATASNLNATVVGTGTFVVQATLAAETTKVIGVTRTADGSGNLITSTSNALDVNLKTSAASNISTNIAQINGVTPLMGNGITGTGSLRVTIASDNTAFAVNATLSAETTKVIGVVRNSDGAGNLWTSNSTTYTAKFAQDSNLLGTLGTAFSTAGKVDIKGADGDVFVRQTTGSNLHTVLDSGTLTTLTTLTGTTSLTPGTGATNLGKAEDAGHTSGDTGVMALAVRNDTRGSLAGTDLDYAPPQLNSSGDMRTELSSVGGTAVSTGNGVSGSGVQRVTLASDSTGQVALAAGTAAIGDVNVNPAARGGYSTYFANAVTTTVTVSGGAGKFGGYMVINLNSAPAYLQFFDTTGAVTLGVTTPTFVIPIPANATAANGLAANLELVNGAALTNGLKMAATTTSTGGSTVATGITGTVWYK